MKTLIRNSIAVFLLLVALGVPAWANESFRGFFEGDLTGGGKIVFFISDNSSISAYVFDTATQTVSSGSGAIDSTKAFSITLANNSVVTGTVAIGSHMMNGATITASYNGQSVTANEASIFGRCDPVAGLFTGTATSTGSTLTNVNFLIDSSGNIFFTAQNNTTQLGGFGTLTLQHAQPASNNQGPHNGPGITGNFTITLVTGETVTGTISSSGGPLSITFTYNGAQYTFSSNRDSALNHLANISTRGFVNTGQGQLIGGFIITGGPKLVLIRALGPSLAAQGVTPVLADPKLQLIQNGAVLEENDNWQTNSNASDITATTLAPTNANESAILTRLEPGAYTAIVTGADGGTGIALVEVYEADRD